jgi:hypothetical protein
MPVSERRLVNYWCKFLTVFVSAQLRAFIPVVSEGLRSVEKPCFRIPDINMDVLLFSLVSPALRNYVEFCDGYIYVSLLNFVESKTEELCQQHPANQSRFLEGLDHPRNLAGYRPALEK